MHVDTTETLGADAHLQFRGICLANFDHRGKVLIIGIGNTDPDIAYFNPIKNLGNKNRCSQSVKSNKLAK